MSSSSRLLIKTREAMSNQFIAAEPLQRIIFALLFIFPIGATYIRHWVSYIFVILFLLSCYYLFTKKKINLSLVKEEKIFLSILGLHFIIFLVSALVNVWGKNQTYALGLELRVLVAIPIYLMLKNINFPDKFLFYGCFFGLIGGFIYGLYEFWEFTERFSYFRVTGVYGYLFIGPVSVLFLFMFLSVFEKFEHVNKLIISAVLIIGVMLSFFSSAKSSWVALFLSLLIVLMNQVSTKTLMLALIGMIAIVVSTYFVTDSYRESSTNFAYVIDRTANQFVNYINAEDKSSSKYTVSGVGLRLEAWRSSKYFMADYPVLGIGQGNFNERVNVYINEGKVHPAVARLPHVHNVFVEMLINRGIPGLLVVLMLYFYPLYLFLKYRHVDRNIALAGILFVTCITVFSLTESAPLIKNNFVAIFLIFLTTIFSAFINKKKEFESGLKA